MSKSIFTQQEVSEDNPYANLAAGVGYSNPYAPLMLSPEEQQEQYVAEAMQADVEKVDSGEGLTSNDLEMAARAFVDGLWLNKSEEVGSYMGALAVKLFNPELAQGQSISDIAASMKTQLEAESAQFAEESPVLSIGANVVGGVLSPVSLAGGKVLSEAARIRQSAKAAKTQADVARTLGQTPASTEAALLAQQLRAQQFAPKTALGVPLPESVQAIAPKVAEVASKVRTPVAAAAFGGAEGAIIGAEGQTAEEKAQNAALTAGISAGVPFAFAGVKKIYDFATEPMAQQLGEGADFINLMFTNHFLAQGYRNVISKAYGGRTLSEQQARRVVGKAVTPKAAEVVGQEIKAEAKRATKIANEAVSLNKREAIEETNLLLNERIAEVKRLAENSTGDLKRLYDETLAELEEAKTNANLGKVMAAKEADALVSQTEALFRGRALRESAPPGATADEVNSLGAMSAQDANLKLDELWRKYGFKAADGKQYQVDSTKVESFIDDVAEDFPELALIGGEQGGIVPRVKQYVLSVLEKKSQDGVIQGQDLLQIRSDIGRAITALSDGSFSTRRFATEVQEYFDDLLEQGLTKEEAASFAADRAAWAVRSTVDSAIGSASGRSAAAGTFTPSDFLGAAQSYSQRLAARGKLSLQREAQETVALGEKNKQNIIDLANDQALQVAKDAIKQKSAAKATLTRQRKEVLAARDKEIAELRREANVGKASAERRAALNTRINETKERYAIQLADIDAKVQQASLEVEALKELMPGSFKSTVFENLFNTALVGQAALFAGPRSMSESIKNTLYTGVVGANILARESTQRILARQSQGQANVRQFFGDLGQGLESRGVSTADLSAGGATAVAAVAAPDKQLLFSPVKRDQLKNLPIQGRAALYRNLKAKGQLERLKAEDPALYKSLKQAAEAGRT